MRKLPIENYDQEDYQAMDRYLNKFNSSILPNKFYAEAAKNDAVKRYDQEAIKNNIEPVSAPAGNAKQYSGLYSDNFLSASKETGLDTNFIAGIGYQESKYDPNAGSTKGARGIMQLTPIAIKELERYGVKITNVNDPAQNIKGGAVLMSNLIKQFGNKELALAAYNAGSGNVRKWIKEANSKDWNKISAYLKRTNQFEETVNYVPSVLNHYQTINKKGKI